LVDALVESKLAASKGEARRGLEQKGFSLNGTQLDADRPLVPDDFLFGSYLLLQKGKRNYALISVE
jgi:tyrosyl-tRNA synthetase